MPFFIIAKYLGLLDSRAVIVLALVAVNQPFTIWMLRTFFLEVPKELEEAAMMDGCGRVGAMFRVVLPLPTPGIVATGIFAFLDAWNNLRFPLTLVTEIEMKTLPPGMILYFTGQLRTDWGGMMATSFLTTLPIVLIFALVQRYLVAGQTSGAVKG